MVGQNKSLSISHKLGDGKYHLGHAVHQLLPAHGCSWQYIFHHFFLSMLNDSSTGAPPLPQSSSMADTTPCEDIFLCIAPKLSFAKCQHVTPIVDHPELFHHFADVYHPRFLFCAYHQSVWVLLICRYIPHKRRQCDAWHLEKWPQRQLGQTIFSLIQTNPEKPLN